jgi:hypothetical protein
MSNSVQQQYYIVQSSSSKYEPCSRVLSLATTVARLDGGAFLRILLLFFSVVCHPILVAGADSSKSEVHYP